MGELWRIIQHHLDEFGVREAEFARRIGTTPSTVNSWKNRGVRNLPDKRLLEAVAQVSGEKYSKVLLAALVDIGYLQAGDRLGEGGGRRRHGAWELGPEMMVNMLLAAEQVEWSADNATNHSDEDDIDEVISDAEQLVDASYELVKIVEAVAELGVGGATHLALARAKEVQRRKELRERARAMGKRATTVTRADSPPPIAKPIVQDGQDEKKRQSDYDLVHRTRDPRVPPEIPDEPDYTADPEGPEEGA